MLEAMTAQSRHYHHKFDEFLDLYRETCAWFTGIGFEWASTRYGVYEKVFSDFERIAKLDDIPPADLEKKRAFDNAYLEANEIIRVYTDLQTLEAEEFLDQLRRVLSGQEFRGMVDNDQARDFLFELSTAARFLRANFRVLLSGVCDVVVDTPHGKIFIECKRLKSPKKIDNNVKKAADQIKKRIGKRPSKMGLGLVALNVSDLIDVPKTLFPDSPQAATTIQKKLADRFVSENADRLIPKTSSKRMLGVMIEFSAMWYLSTHAILPALIYTRHTNFLQMEKPDILAYLAPKICNQDIVL